MAVGKRVFAAVSYIRTPHGELAPGERVSEDDPRYIKEMARYYEQVDVIKADTVAAPKGKK